MFIFLFESSATIEEEMVLIIWLIASFEALTIASIFSFLINRLFKRNSTIELSSSIRDYFRIR